MQQSRQVPGGATFTAKVLTCQECGTQFLWTVPEQRYCARKGMDPPELCHACRRRSVAGEQISHPS